MSGKEFIDKIKERKRVFGNPSYIFDDIGKLIEEENSNYLKKFSKSDFTLNNAEIAAKKARITKLEKAAKSSGNYFIKILNTENTEIWNNAILFCNICLNNNGPVNIIPYSPKKNDDEEPSSFINMEEVQKLSFENHNSTENGIPLEKVEEWLLLGDAWNDGSECDDEDEYDGEGENSKIICNNYYYNFCLCLKNKIFFINVFNILTNDSLPTFIMDDRLRTASQTTLLDLSPSIWKRSCIEYLDVIFNKNGLLVLKNANWRKASSILIHISEFKRFIEEESKNCKEIPFKERLEIMSRIYDSIYKRKKTEFSKNIDRAIKEDKIK